jgi:hypothetical protein
VHPLLPVSNRRVGDVVVDPTRSLVAFVATDAAGQQQLCVSSLSALNSVPRQLTQFAGIPGNAYGPDNYGMPGCRNYWGPWTCHLPNEKSYIGKIPGLVRGLAG